MQVAAALPHTAGLGATSVRTFSSRRRIHGAQYLTSKDLVHERDSSCSSWFKLSLPPRYSTSSGRVRFSNLTARAENSDYKSTRTVAEDDEQQWRGVIDVDSLVQGEVGRIALVATLLLGVGTLAATGSAEAATVHLRDGLHSSVDVDMRSLAMGPEGPLLEEFWDNMRRYGFYFLTVASGGIYSLLKPLIDALRNPVTAILVIIVITGTIYLVGLTVSAMLGINEYQYDYAP